MMFLPVKKSNTSWRNIMDRGLVTLLHKTLIDVLEWCGLLWCFYQLFGLSFWRHPFTAVDPLVSNWCNATFLQICFDEKTNSFISWMDWGSMHVKRIIFLGGWTIPLKANSHHSHILEQLLILKETSKILCTDTERGKISQTYPAFSRLSMNMGNLRLPMNLWIK